MRKMLFAILLFVSQLIYSDEIDGILKQSLESYKQEDYLSCLKLLERAQSIIQMKFNQKYSSTEITEINDFVKYNIVWKNYLGQRIKFTAKFYSASDNLILFAQQDNSRLISVAYSEQYQNKILQLNKSAVYTIIAVVVDSFPNLILFDIQ